MFGKLVRTNQDTGAEMGGAACGWRSAPESHLGSAIKIALAILVL